MVKCITFDKNAQDALPQHIKDKMKKDREAVQQMPTDCSHKRICTNAKPNCFKNCGSYYGDLNK